MSADKTLIIAIIERERQLFDMAAALETAGLIPKSLGARSDLVLLAFGIEPDPLCDELPDILFDGFEAGESSEIICEKLLAKTKEVAR